MKDPYHVNNSYLMFINKFHLLKFYVLSLTFNKHPEEGGYMKISHQN